MDKYYKIGGHLFKVTGERLATSVSSNPGFLPFEVNAEDNVDFEFEEWQGDESEIPVMRKSLYRYSFENVVSNFGLTDNGYLHEQIISDNETTRMWSHTGENKIYIHGNLETYLVNYAVGMGYELMTVSKDTVLVHSSCMVCNGKVIMFLGKSGTGKSTHSRLWRENISGCYTLNDDCPIVRIENGEVWVYGNPWSGKEPCYHQERHPLAGFVRLSQAPYNKITKLTRPLQLYAALHPSFFSPFANDNDLYDYISSMIKRIISAVPVYLLECLPDKEAALLSYRTFFSEETK